MVIETRPTVEMTCPAKVNLALSVGDPLPERGDNMHPIASWMAAINFGDKLVMRSAKGPVSKFRVRFATDAPVPAQVDWPLAEDLVYRAHQLMERHLDRRLPVEVELDKRVPPGSGLGGGSSDAAAVLVGLESMFGLDLGESALMKLGLQLGSDVGFFVAAAFGAKSAVVTGFGDKIKAAPSQEILHLVLIFPPFGCPTGPVYKALDQMRQEPAIDHGVDIVDLGANGDGDTDGERPVRRGLESTAASRMAKPALRLKRRFKRKSLPPASDDAADSAEAEGENKDNQPSRDGDPESAADQVDSADNALADVAADALPQGVEVVDVASATSDAVQKGDRALPQVVAAQDEDEAEPPIVAMEHVVRDVDGKPIHVVVGDAETVEGQKLASQALADAQRRIRQIVREGLVTPAEDKVWALAESSPVAQDGPFNDLTAPARRVCTELGPLMEEVAEQLELSIHLSGSGSTLFLIAPSAVTCKALARKVTALTGLPALAVRTL